MTPTERIVTERKLDALAAEIAVLKVGLAIDEEGSFDWEDTTLRRAKRCLERKRDLLVAMVDACGDEPMNGVK